MTNRDNSFQLPDRRVYRRTVTIGGAPLYADVLMNFAPWIYLAMVGRSGDLAAREICVAAALQIAGVEPDRPWFDYREFAESD